MAVNQRRLEGGSTDDYESEPSISSTDELAGISALARGAAEIQKLQHFFGPIIVPILTPLIRQVVKEQIGLAKQEILASMKENLANKASTSVPKKLKLQFGNKISLPVFTGKRLLGENGTTIEIALVDAITEQIVKMGPESMAKLEIVGFRVGDDENSNVSLTFEDFQKKIMSEKKGKRTLQGITCLQLKEGVCFVDKISFTHSSENTKKGFYRLVAGVVDTALMTLVEVAMTESFLMKDGRVIYSEKHPHPPLSDKVCHLQQIGYKGTRYKHLEDAGVITVEDLLRLFYTNPKRLEDILQVKASSKIWNDIIKNAHASNGMFLYLDPRNERKTGAVLDVKLQLKGLIVEPYQYIPVNHLSDQQKVDNQNLVKFASEHLDILRSFEDETALKKYLQSGPSFTSANQSLTSKMTDGPPTPSSQVTSSSPSFTESSESMNKSNHASQRGKEKASSDDERVLSKNYYQEHILFHPPNLENPNGLNFGTATEPGTSSQAIESLSDTCGFMDTYDNFSPTLEEMEEWQRLLSYDYNIHLESPNNEWHPNPANSDADVVMLAAQTVSVSVTIAGTRWRKVSKLLRRNSVRERIISVSDGIQALKKQRCC